MGKEKIFDEVVSIEPGIILEAVFRDVSTIRALFVVKIDGNSFLVFDTRSSTIRAMQKKIEGENITELIKRILIVPLRILIKKSNQCEGKNTIYFVFMSSGEKSARIIIDSEKFRQLTINC